MMQTTNPSNRHPFIRGLQVRPQPPLRQLRNPRYKLYTADLPDGVTGIVSDGITDWRTDSSRPDSLDAIYFRSKL